MSDIKKVMKEVEESLSRCECLIYAARGRDLPCYFCANPTPETNKENLE